MTLYAKNSSKLSEIIRLGKDDLKNKYHPESVRRWIKNNRFISLEALKDQIGDEQIWTLLNGTRIRAKTSKRTMRVNEQISSSEAIILAWILAEGSLARHRISVSQSKKCDLEALKDIIVNNFDLGESDVKIYPDKDKYSLRLSSVFEEYFHQKYLIPRGSKSKIIRMPHQILKTNLDVKRAFLAAYIETDGSICFYRRTLISGIKYRAPRVNIGSASKEFIKDIHELFHSLGYHPRLNFNEKHKYYITQLSKAREVERLFYDIQPYMLCKSKILKYQSLLSEYKELKRK